MIATPAGLAPAAVLESLPVPALAFDLDRRVTAWNPAAARLYGASAADVAGRPVARFVPPDARGTFDRAVAAVVARGEWAGELAAVAADETPLTIDARWSAVRDAGGRVAGVSAVHLDVTAARRRATACGRGWRVRVAAAVASAAAEGAARAGDEPTARQLAALARPLAPATSEAAVAGDGPVLLVVADPLVRALAALHLEARGVPAFATGDGSEAVEWLAGGRTGARAAVVDAGLPRWAAAGLVRELRGVDPLLPVVLLGGPAGRVPADDVQACCPTPFTAEDLAWAVGEAASGATNAAAVVG